ncbi:MAG: tail fiber domain-containing protein [Tenuifilaceae bacterium]
MKAKAFTLLLLLVLLAFSIFPTYSQAPQGFSYQAVIRSSTGAVIANQNVSIKLSLTSAVGTPYYVETQTATTTPNGVVNLTVGSGTLVSGAFTSVPWSTGDIRLKVEVDATGGTSYTEMGNTRLYSVPYAFFASNGPAGNGIASVSDNSDGTLTLHFDNGASYITPNLKGPQGVQGPVGPTGPQGTQGVAGPAGVQGVQGPAGPAGAQGIQGPAGPKGDKGDAGTGLTNRGGWVSGTTYNPSDYVFSESTGNSAVNSMWIVQATATITSTVLPKSDLTNWVEFQAPQGPEGPVGPAGPQGLQGLTGPQGQQGVQGTQGEQGPIGPQGQQGDQGPAGLAIAGTVGQTITHSGTDWTATNAITVSGQNVGIGTTTPLTKLVVKSETSALPEDPIFEVRNKDNQVVLGVYNEGVRVYVADAPGKGARGGFAVGGLTNQNKGTEQEYLRITPDSARIYVNEVSTGVKGARGGFAVGGLTTQNKTTTTSRDLLYIAPDSARIYIKDTVTTKGARGGFAVGGLTTQSKGVTDNYLYIHRDSSRIYIDDDLTSKGARGGFAVGGLTTQSKDGSWGSSNFFNIETTENYIINPSQARILWYPLKHAFLTGDVKILTPADVGQNSFSSGFESKAKGQYSQALGYKASALGDYSTAIGKNAVASNSSSFAFGDEATAASEFSYAFGKSSHANGLNSFAFGESVIAGLTTSVTNAYAFGRKSEARGSNSYALGDSAIAEGANSFALGGKSIGFGISSYALGKEANAHGNSSYAFGEYSTATGIGSYAFGSTARDGEGNILPAFKTIAEGDYSFALGLGAKATQMLSFAIGTLSEAANVGDFAIGMQNTASGGYSLAIGLQNTSSGQTSVSIGHKNTTSGTSSISIGNWNQSSNGGFSFGAHNRSDTTISVAIGFDNIASGLHSISLGERATSSGSAAVATGFNSTSRGDYSFSSGYRSTAIGTSSFSANNNTKSTGYHSAAFGYYTVARAFGSFVVGHYNDTTGIASTSMYAQTDPLFVVGNGWEEAHRSNAFTVLNNGNVGIRTSTPLVPLHIKGNEGILNLEGDDHCYIQFYPDTYGAGRKGFFGYPGAGINDISLTNLIAGGNISLMPGSSGSVDIQATGAALKVNNKEALWYDGDYFSWGYGGNSNFFDDFVGLGKTYPTERLELGGSEAKIFLNSTTSNMIKFNDYGVAAPTTTTRSLGTKLVLYPGISTTYTDYALGIEDWTMWLSVPNSSNLFKFYAGTAEIMRIQGNGKVGIGTTNPSEKLELGGSNAKIYLNSGTSNMVTFNTSGVAAPTYTTRSAGTKIVLYPGLTASASDYAIGMEPSTMWLSIPSSADFFKFYAGTDEIIRIKGDGNVGLGTNNPGFKLEVFGTAAKTGGGVWSVASDARLKDIHGDYTSGIREIMKLKPILFNYKVGNPKNLPSQEEYIGFIAQDVQLVFPEAVKTGTDGYLSFDMHPVNVAVINALKEHQQEIELVKSENQQLKTQLEVIMAELEVIKAMLKK